jgi:predicted nucleic acid-binding protein
VILIDTSVWAHHFRSGIGELSRLLQTGEILCHPFVIGELALATMRQRAWALQQLVELPRCAIATDEEVLEFIQKNALFGRGIGYVDVHLLAAARITPGSLLWSFDKRLHRLADEFGMAFRPRS